jgi:SHS2 domain-containing protein
VAETFRILEHTADMGIEAAAATLEALFEQAARGLCALLAPPTVPGGDGRGIELHLESADREELLVAWLNELLYLIQSRSLWPVDLVVEEITVGRLEARLQVRSFDPGRHRPRREIKAVTFHQLVVRHGDSGWWTRYYVDV